MPAAFRLALGAVCISFAPIFVKASDLSPSSAGIYRCAFGALCFLLFYLAQSRERAFSIKGRALAMCILAGLIFAIDLSFWHRSIEYAGAGLSTILGNTQVFYLSLVGVLFFKEPLRPRFILATLLGFGGICLLVGFGEESARHPKFFLGVVYGLATGVVYAAYISALRSIEKNFPDISASLRMFLISLISCGGLIVAAHQLQEFEWLQGMNWFMMIGLGVVAQFAGWFLISKNLSQVEISKAGLIILIQPLLATLMGGLFFGEALSHWQAIGGFMTLSGIYLGSLYRAGS